MLVEATQSLAVAVLFPRKQMQLAVFELHLDIGVIPPVDRWSHKEVG